MALSLLVNLADWRSLEPKKLQRIFGRCWDGGSFTFFLAGMSGFRFSIRNPIELISLAGICGCKPCAHLLSANKLSAIAHELLNYREQLYQ